MWLQATQALLTLSPAEERPELKVKCKESRGKSKYIFISSSTLFSLSLLPSLGWLILSMTKKKTGKNEDGSKNKIICIGTNDYRASLRNCCGKWNALAMFGSSYSYYSAGYLVSYVCKHGEIKLRFIGKCDRYFFCPSDFVPSSFFISFFTTWLIDSFVITLIGYSRIGNFFLLVLFC